MLPDIVSYIKRRLLADWSDINFIIGTNPEDYIELRFSMSSIDAPSGLKAYMGTLVDQDEMMLQYQLRRVTQFWGTRGAQQNASGSIGSSPNGRKRKAAGDSDLPGAAGPPIDRGESDIPTEEGGVVDDIGYSREEDYVYYMLAPPWARHKDPILYLQ